MDGRRPDNPKFGSILPSREKRRGFSPENNRGKRRFDSRGFNDHCRSDASPPISSLSSRHQSDYYGIRHSSSGNDPHFQRRSDSPEEVGEIRQDCRSYHSVDRKRDYRNNNHLSYDRHYHHHSSRIVERFHDYRDRYPTNNEHRTRPGSSFSSSSRHHLKETPQSSDPPPFTSKVRRLGDRNISESRQESRRPGPPVNNNVSNEEMSLLDDQDFHVVQRKSSLLLTPDEPNEGEVSDEDADQSQLLFVTERDGTPSDIRSVSRSRSKSLDSELRKQETERMIDRGGTSPEANDKEYPPAGASEEDSEPESPPEPLEEKLRNPLLNGCGKVDQYRRLNKISEGTYGAVYRAQHKPSHSIVALKHIKYHEKVWEEGFPLTSLREISILLELNHPNIVNVVEIVVGENPNQVFMVMEYVEHELKLLLEDNRPQFSTSERKRLIFELLQAVEHLHSRWVIHRDLKTSNLLYNNKGQLKICDFGMARKYGDPIKAYTQNVVTMWYRAPELLLGQEKYTQAVDMWSVGCIMAEILLRRPLFDGHTETDTLDKILRLCGTPTEDTWPGLSSLPAIVNKRLEFARHHPTWRKVFPVPRPSFTDPSALSESGLDLLRCLLCLNPAERISAREAVKHPFFNENPLPQRNQLMPTAPDTNQRNRALRHSVGHWNEQDLADRETFYGDIDSRYTLGTRIDPQRYLIEMETAAQQLQQKQAEKQRETK